jgi:PmbA protein
MITAQTTQSTPAKSLKDRAQTALDMAKRLGATAAEVEVSHSNGLSVSVRKGEVETIEHNRDRGLSITVYFGLRKGNASTTDFSDEALQRTVQAACTIAKYTSEDSASGLADPTRLALGELRNLDLYHPFAVTTEHAISLALEAEAAALAFDPRIKNSDGASFGSGEGDFIYANSNGFCNGYPTSRFSLSMAPIAEDASGMQRDYWYSSERIFNKLTSAKEIGQHAAQRALRRLSAKRVATCEVPVLFEANLAGGLVSSLVGAASGGSLYRKASFLVDKAGSKIASDKLNIFEDPHVPQGEASSMFDSEGVATTSRELISKGVLNGYFLGSYSARKLGLQSTGNAGGNHNLIIQSTGESFDQLLKKMGRGLIVTELMGQGVNTVTGDYSRGATGLWVEGGEVAYPVEEVTIASNLLDMYANIEAVGSDVLKRGSKTIGSVLVGKMTVAGE